MCIVTVFVCKICTPWHKDNKILGISNLFLAIGVTFFFENIIVEDLLASVIVPNYAWRKV